MQTQIFINMPVKDLKKSMEFFSHLGYSFNKQFTDENAACMVISDTIYVMLLLEPFFKSFTHQEIANTHQVNEMIVSLSVNDRVEVDAFVQKAKQAGAKVTKEAVDYGSMYQHGFTDLDGHLWEVFYMDPASVQPQT